MGSEHFGQDYYPPLNRIRKHIIGDMEIEMIHQTRPGDCVLINFLNTYSIMHEGKIIMSPRELRDLVIEKGRQSGEDPGDILNDDQPLSYTDVVRLFSLVLGSRPKQEDIVTVRTDNLTRGQVENNIENGILEYLDTYQSGLCTTGLGYHSRSIWKLDADNYILIDPMNENGFEKKNRGQLVDFLANIMLNQPANNNFFFFLREENDEQ